MELYHLRTFVTVAEEGHLTRASERLFTSQPAVSAQIKALEEELGVTLFDRTPRGMQLTAAGDRLLAAARTTLSSADSLLHEARSLRDELIGSVRIGLNTDARFLRLIALQAALAERHPRLELEFMAGSTGANLPALRIGRLDASFISGACDDPRLASWVLCEEELAVAAPAAWRERLVAADVAALARQPWVFTSEDCAHYGVMRSLFEAHGCTPRKTVLANQEDALAAMVEGGFGLGIMRRELVVAGEAEGRLHLLPMTLPTVSLRFACLRQRADDPLLKAVITTIAGLWGVAVVGEQRRAV
ncbi:MAG: LysR family transcriptional regulator [Rhodocyclaceae bacterium]|nr:LysR family transcriptional regulator [Rhodocyclaceae bacterium]